MTCEVGMEDDEKNEKDQTPKAWIAAVLPREAALSLVRAARLARTLPIGSLARAQAIRNAEKKAKSEYPRLFRDDDSYGKR